MKHHAGGLDALLTYEEEVTPLVPGIEDIRILRGLRSVQDHGTPKFVEQAGAFKNAHVFFKHLKKSLCKD
jgi:hypothetical protein